jgi:hypothetical protein
MKDVCSVCRWPVDAWTPAHREGDLVIHLACLARGPLAKAIRWEEEDGLAECLWL